MSQIRGWEHRCRDEQLQVCLDAPSHTQRRVSKLYTLFIKGTLFCFPKKKRLELYREPSGLSFMTTLHQTTEIMGVCHKSSKTLMIFFQLKKFGCDLGNCLKCCLVLGQHKLPFYLFTLFVSLFSVLLMYLHYL